MIHPSLLTAIERPKYIRDADWAHEFLCKSTSIEADAISAAHFSARVQEVPSSGTDGTRPLVVFKPQLACDFEKNSALIEDGLGTNSDQRLSASQTASTIYTADSPSSGLNASPTPLSPYRSSPSSRTFQLRSLRTNLPMNEDDDAASPTKYLDIDDKVHLVSSATNALKAIARMQRLLEADRDGVILRQLW
jgi:hypothetical protein